MAASPSYRDRPPLQGIRRSFTTPTRPSTTFGQVESDQSDAKYELLYDHPSARILSFSPPTDHIKSSAMVNLPHDTDYPIDAIETLAWRSRKEVLLDSGRMIVEKVQGSTCFLKSNTFVHPFLRNTQCWCVDGESKFVIRKGQFMYYRIELPSTSEEDKKKVEDLKAVFAGVLRYEKTPCPFVRQFSVDLPDDAITPRRKGPWSRRASSQATSIDDNGSTEGTAHNDKRWTIRSPPTSYPKNAPGFAPFSPGSSFRGSSEVDSPRTPSVLFSPEPDDDNDRYEENYHDDESNTSKQISSDNEEDAESRADNSNLDEARGRAVVSRQASNSIPVSVRIASIERSGTHVNKLPTPTSTRRMSSVDAKRLWTAPPKAIRQSVENGPRHRDSTQDPSEINSSSHDPHVTAQNNGSMFHPKDSSSQEVQAQAVGLAFRAEETNGAVDTYDQEPESSVTLVENGMKQLESKAKSVTMNGELSEPQRETSSPTRSAPSLMDDDAHSHALADPDSTILTSSPKVTLQTSEHIASHVQNANSNAAADHDSVASEYDKEEAASTKSAGSVDTEHKTPALSSDLLDLMNEQIAVEPSGIHSHLGPTTSELSDEMVPGPSRGHEESRIELEETSDSSSLTDTLTTETELPPMALTNSAPEIGLGIVPDTPTTTTQCSQVEEQDDQVSIVSDADSFYTLASTLTRSQSAQDYDADATPIASEFDHFARPFANHHRGRSELTVMSSTSPGYADAQTDIDSETRHTGDFHVETMTDAPEHDVNREAMASLHASLDVGLRQRQRARRSFSPMPPRSIITTHPNPPNHDMQHIVNVILQHAVKKPLEIVRFIVNVLARIASGATPSDLMSGELFRQPIHTRQVSGFADHQNRLNRDDDQEDDYGNPLRGFQQSAVDRDAHFGEPTPRRFTTREDT